MLCNHLPYIHRWTISSKKAERLLSGNVIWQSVNL